MYLLFIWGGTKWFWCGIRPFRGPLKGVGPENRDFFGPYRGWALLVSDFRFKQFRLSSRIEWGQIPPPVCQNGRPIPLKRIMLLFFLGDVWSGLEVETTVQWMNQFQMGDIIIQSSKFLIFFIKLKNQEPAALLTNQMALIGVFGTQNFTKPFYVHT
jgi:hypothetical protein